MMRTWIAGSLTLIASVALAGGGNAPANAPNPDQALDAIKQGNQRFVSGQVTNPNTDNSRRVDTAQNGQHPFVAILTCADSRLPVERIFDQGIGDIFAVRVAGNIADTNEIGSLEYAAEHLHAPLIVVMGHEKCGAVAAAATRAELTGSTAALVRKIEPAVTQTQQEHPELQGDSLIAATIRTNVNDSIENLITRSEIIRKLINEHKVRVIGAVYNIETGQVEWLGQHPDLVTLTKGETRSKSDGKQDNQDNHAGNGHAQPAKQNSPAKPNATGKSHD
jgi:carbonic anhydrase